MAYDLPSRQSWRPASGIDRFRHFLYVVSVCLTARPSASALFGHDACIPLTGNDEDAAFGPPFRRITNVINRYTNPIPDLVPSRYSFHKTINRNNIYQRDQDVRPKRREHNRQQEDRPFLAIRNSSYSGSPPETDREWYVSLIYEQRSDKAGEITQSDVDLVKQGYRWMSVSATASPPKSS